MLLERYKCRVLTANDLHLHPKPALKISEYFWAGVKETQINKKGRQDGLSI